jgi:hypothetical protein
VTSKVVNLIPKYKAYVDERGVKYTVMSSMWLKLLTNASPLREFGYKHSRTDQCVMWKVKGERIFLLLIFGLVELIHEFVEFVTMEKVPTPIIYQDSTSVTSLITKGGGL